LAILRLSLLQASLWEVKPSLTKRYSIVPKEVKDYVRGFYGRPPAPIDDEIKLKIKKLIIGGEEPIKCRPADLLEPFLDKIPEEVKRYFRQEEDVLTYALFPTAALEFFKKRVRKEKKLELEAKREKLVEVAAVSAALALQLSSEEKVRAVIPIRRRVGVSP